MFQSGCSKGPREYHYLIAEKSEPMPPFTMHVTMVQRYEKSAWCESSLERYPEEEGFKAVCEKGRVELDPMFEEKKTGFWYVLQRFGRFPPLVIIYEFTPAIPDEYMLKHLEQIRPHSLQFAALHKAPAEVHIIAPDGTVH